MKSSSLNWLYIIYVSLLIGCLIVYGSVMISTNNKGITKNSGPIDVLISLIPLAIVLLIIIPPKYLSCLHMMNDDEGGETDGKK